MLRQLFEHQPEEYRAAVLPPDVTRRVAVEQASTLGWDRYTGLRGTILGMKTFGASAPLKELLKYLPGKVAQCRIFAMSHEHDPLLAAALEEALGDDRPAHPTNL